MAFVVVREPHAIPDRPPLVLETGDAVAVKGRSDEWPAFVFVKAGHGSGWVPSRHLSADTGEAVVVAPYDTTELPTSAGEVLKVVERDDESGWLWCRSRSGREGWVPARALEATRAPEPGIN